MNNIKQNEKPMFYGKIEQDLEALTRYQVPNLTDWSKQPMQSNDQSTIAPAIACSIAGCGKPKHTKGLCKRHYQQLWATGSTEIRRPNPRGTPIERFWRYVDKKGAAECWNWTAFRDKDGYGKFRSSTSVNIGAHRFSYELHKGPILDALLVRHLCNNSACVNPDHLSVGDHIDNMQDRHSAGHYPTGERHPFAKFSDEIVAQVKQAHGTNRSLAKQYGMSESQVGNIRRGDQRQVS